MAIARDREVIFSTSTEGEIIRIGISKSINNYSEKDLLDYAYVAATSKHFSDEDFEPHYFGYNMFTESDFTTDNGKKQPVKFVKTNFNYYNPNNINEYVISSSEREIGNGIFCGIIWLYYNGTGVYPTSVNSSDSFKTNLFVVTNFDASRILIDMSDINSSNYTGFGNYGKPDSWENPNKLPFKRSLNVVGYKTKEDMLNNRNRYDLPIRPYFLYIHDGLLFVISASEFIYYKNNIISMSKTDLTNRVYGFFARPYAFNGTQTDEKYYSHSFRTPIDFGTGEFSVNNGGSRVNGVIKNIDYAASYHNPYRSGYYDDGGDLEVAPNTLQEWNSYIARYGLYFKTDKFYKPVIESNYVSGYTEDLTAKSDIDNYSYDDGNRHDIPPAPPNIDPNDKIDSMGMNNVLGNGGNFLNIYNCNHGAITQIATWLDSRELVTGYDPLSYNVALLEYPMDIGAYIVPKQTGAHILFGRIEHVEEIPDPADSGATGDKIWDQVVIMDVGSFVLWKKFGDFRDYDPYTQCTVYIPYFGEIPIDVQLHAGKTINAKIAIDVGSGAAICCIFADNILISKVNTTLANEVPLTSENWGVKRAGQMQATASTISSVISAAATIGTIAVGGFKALAAKQAATTAIRAVRSTPLSAFPTAAQAGAASAATSNAYQARQKFSQTFDASVVASGIGGVVSSVANAIATKNKSYSTISGSIGSRAEQAAPMRPFARVTRVKSVIPDQYGHERGYVCDFTARLGDLVGLTVTNNVDTSGLSCTAEERVQVKQILDSGVYL